MAINLKRKNAFRPETDLRFCLISGGLLGIAAFLLIYGFSTLDVTYDSWVYAGYIEEDIIQHYAGWMFYKNSPWCWPPAVASNASDPIGFSIAFTDSIPLLAIILKLFEPIMPQNFQYFGWYNLVNFALQGSVGCLLLRSFKLSRTASLISSLLFVLSPVFIERIFRHTSLSFHWVILLAIYFYFDSRRRKQFFALGFIILCTIAVGLHSYYVPMVYAILAAALLEKAISRKQALRSAAILGICFLGTFSMAYLTGIVTRGNSLVSEGFGSYCMNLNALFNPRSFDYYAGDKYMGWSAFLPVRDQQIHNYDGFNYLGLGVILCLSIMLCYGLYKAARAAILRDKAFFAHKATFLKSHIWLVLVCLALTIFAISNVFMWDGITLFKIPLAPQIERLCNIFRASGRMFWVCYYLLLLSAAVFVSRVLKGRLKMAVLIGLVAVQVIDISPALIQKHKYFANGEIVASGEFESEGWRFLAENYNYVQCLGNLFHYSLAAGIIRYNPNMKSNVILTNRGSYPHISIVYEETLQSIKKGERLTDGVLYLCSDEPTFNELLATLHKDARGYKIGKFYAVANPMNGCPLPEYLPKSAEASV